MSDRNLIGELVVIHRIEAEKVSVEWRIPNFLSLSGGSDDYYESEYFGIGDGHWKLTLWPNWKREKNNLSSGMVNLGMDRFLGDPRPTHHITVGIRGSAGVEKIRGGENEIRGHISDCYNWYEFCTRSELVEQRHRLIPDGVLTITCVLERPVGGFGSLLRWARGLLSSSINAASSTLQPNVPVEARSGVREAAAPSNIRPPSDKRGELPSGVLVTYSYKELQKATQNFGGRCKIGEGGFASVYRAVIRGDVVAVKRLKDPVDKQFITELRTLTNYKHENLLSLLGCSMGPTCCLVYEFMPNGSLEVRLDCDNRSEPLSWQTRLFIAHGSALGINHLHTSGNKPVVHRDIKSANILLDRNLVPKVGDFGLVRTGDSSGSTTMAVTGVCCGTPGYMPREALLGDVSVKWDTFSFGVVLLELLTGLPPYDPRRGDKFLIIHMENCKDIVTKMDPKAKWNKKVAIELYRITQRCLAESKRSRPYISEILEDLRKLSLLR